MHHKIYDSSIPIECINMNCRHLWTIEKLMCEISGVSTLRRTPLTEIRLLSADSEILQELYA